MVETWLVYITAPSAQVASEMARALLEKRLVACANILPGVTSHYWWEGQIETTAEAVLICKTRSAQYAAVEAEVKALHPYQTPCIVAWPLAAGNPEFLRWVSEETKGH